MIEDACRPPPQMNELFSKSRGKQVNLEILQYHMNPSSSKRHLPKTRFAGSDNQVSLDCHVNEVHLNQMITFYNTLLRQECELTRTETRNQTAPSWGAGGAGGRVVSSPQRLTPNKTKNVTTNLQLSKETHRAVRKHTCREPVTVSTTQNDVNLFHFIA